MANRLGVREETADSDESKPCQACRLPPEKKRLHWFYSFISTEKLFEHLAEQGIPTTEEYRRAIALWYDRCTEIAREKQLEARRYSEAADHRRRWSLYVREAKTPDEVEAIAAEMLKANGIAAVKSTCAMWRTGGKVKFTDLDDLVRDVPQ